MKHSFALLVVLAFAASAQEWTRFRGPNGTGISHAKSIPTKVTDADVNWRVELPGVGHSSPVLWGNKLFVTTCDSRSGGVRVLCHDALTGKQLWRHDFKQAPFTPHKFNNFAAASPAVDAQHVYVIWNETEHFKLAALDHNGKVAWERDFGPFVSQHGCGISPIVHNGMVILGNEQDDAKNVKGSTRSGESFVVAVDAKTGSTVWQTPRNSLVVAYSTPSLYTPKGGPPALIFNSQGHGIYAVAPDTGKVLWEYAQAFTMRSCSSPMIAGDFIFGSCGSGGGGNYVTVIKAGDAAKGRKPELAYQMKKSAPYVPTGVVVGELAWLWSDAGVLTCLHAPTGDIRYQERVGGNFFGSPVWVDGRLFAASTAGELVVVEASDKFNVLHRFALKELCHSTPAVALGRMFIHTENHLVSLGGAKKVSGK
jgi:outer membrane protein assembly factor BamB